MQEVVSNLYVVGMGLGVVFIGLISIILLCYIIGAVCMSAEKKSAAEEPAAATALPAEPTENRQEIVAAVSAALAEEMGTDISAIRILSFKKI